LLDASRAYDLTPNAVPRPHPLHQPPTHPRYATRQALLLNLFPRRRSQRVPACIGAGMCDTTAVCSGYTSITYTVFLTFRPRPLPHSPLDACASRAPSALPFGTRRAPPRARSTRCRRSLSSPSH
jgi:hypothetical protein